jgi:hypothetical protein
MRLKLSEMEKILKYRLPLLQNCGFDALFQNTQSGILISNIVKHGNYYIDNAETLRNTIVGKYIPQYSDITSSTKEGRKAIAEHLTKEIERMEQQIAEYDLVIQMCRKNKVVKIETA